MAILQSELKLFKSLVVSSTPTTNGGHRSTTEVQSGTAADNFPHAFSAERSAGSTTVRINYCANHSASETIAYNMRIWRDNATAADDYVYFVPVAQGAVEDDLTGSEDTYVVAPLKTAITGGTTSTIVVECDHTDLTDGYRDGDLIRITNKDYPDSVTGTEEFLTITGSPVVVSTEVTITVTTQVVNTYATSNTRVMSVYEAGTVICTEDSYAVTSTSGTYDDTTYPVVLTTEDTVEEEWTVTFSDASNFSVVGTRLGAVGSGTIGSDFEPNNPSTSNPYFSLPALGWGGTWANAETLVFETHDSSVSIAQIREIPAGSASLAGNRATIAMTVESG